MRDFEVDGSKIEEVEVVNDLGVRFSENLAFSEQVTHAAERSSMVGNWMVTCFVVKDVSVYLKLFESHVIPMLLHASQV